MNKREVSLIWCLEYSYLNSFQYLQVELKLVQRVLLYEVLKP